MTSDRVDGKDSGRLPVEAAIVQESLSFDMPSFAPTSGIGGGRGDLARVGVIDVGSNSVRLVVFDGVARSPAYFFNEKVLCGLGRDLSQTGVLHPGGTASAIAAIRRFVALGESLKLTALTAVATAAVRNASDGAEFVDQILKMTGLRIRVITGQEEATLSAQGVLLGRPDARGLVCDIGGSSMELAHVKRSGIVAAETSALGPLVLGDLSGRKRDAHIQAELDRLLATFPKRAERLFLVGGSWRALAHVDMARRAYPLHVLHEYTQSWEALSETAKWLQSAEAEEVKAIAPEVSSQRITLLPLACEVLLPFLKRLRPESVSISSYGLREGLLFAHMPRMIQKLDPLLESARAAEETSARFPGFGDVLYRWLKPLCADWPTRRRRLVRAACLLHDVNWRAHPDYRADVCFETITRATLGGLGHDERIWLGYALLNRYKQSRKNPSAGALLALLDETDTASAEMIGRTMRLGAMVSGGAKSILRQTTLRREDGTLTLELSPRARLQQGEAVARRLAAVAQCLDCEPHINAL